MGRDPKREADVVVPPIRHLHVQRAAEPASEEERAVEVLTPSSEEQTVHTGELMLEPLIELADFDKTPPASWLRNIPPPLPDEE